MTTYVKIDRTTGNIIEQKDYATIKRTFNKRYVWIPLIQEVVPAHDADTQKVVPNVTQPDMTDLSTPVNVNAQRVQGYDIVPLTPTEVQAVKVGKIQNLEGGLTRINEDIMVAIATGTPLERSTFPDAVWNKINARRVLRGEAPV
jgi:hypothetical protein